MTNRITGLATGLDVDSIIKQTMQAYRSKIDTQQQKKDILEIKQKLYRDVITDAQKLYNTQFDLLKSGSLINSKTWQSIKFTSSNESVVTVTGSSTAKTGNYTVTGTKAKAASATLSESELGESIIINGKEFAVEGSTNKEKATNLNKALSNAGINVSVRYTDFANQLTKGDNVQGFIFDSKVLGADNNFVIGGKSASSELSIGVNSTSATITGLTVDNLRNNAVATEKDGVSKITFKIDNKEVTIDIVEESTNEDIKNLLNTALLGKGYTADIDNSGNITLTSTIKGNGQTAPVITIKDKISGEFDEVRINFTDGVSSAGVNATPATVTGLTVSKLQDNSYYINPEKHEEGKRVTFSIGNDVINIDIADGSANDEIKSLINTALSEKGYTADIDKSGNITFISVTKGSEQKSPEIKIKDKTSGEFVGITTDFIDGKDATSAKFTLDSGDLNKSVAINGVSVDLSKLDLSGLEDESAKNSKRVEYINEILANQNIKITASVDKTSGKIILDAEVTGDSSNINFSILNGGTVSSDGSDANIVIKDDNGGIYTHKGISNTITLDGITFNFTGEIPKDKEVSITSKVDSSEVVDKVKSYIEDYNALIVKINTLTSEKRDRSYKPLTADQKKEMSETEIELWESKVKQGQLKGDSDLMRINSSLQQGMRNLVTGTGLTLKDIGIESVEDYGGTKDGTFKINEESLKKAIEDDTEGVMKLFMQSAPSNVSESEKYNQSGIMIRLKDILYNETVTSKSSLAQKVGFEGTVTIVNNTITKSMDEYTKKISDMEKLFSTKEQALYTKYSKLETLMNTYNSQMSYLSQALGLSTS